MENVLRTPWRVEPVDGWRGLFTVRDCANNIVAAANIEEVAKLIATAPGLNMVCLAAAEQVQALRNAISALEDALYGILEPMTLPLDRPEDDDPQQESTESPLEYFRKGV